MSDSDILDLAEGVCEVAELLDGNGALYGAWLLQVQGDTGLDAETIGLATGSAIGAFCPEHSDVVDSLADLYGTS